MRVPIGWLREYVELPREASRIAEMLAQIGFPVDGIEERPAIAGVVVGRITELQKHPNADRLQVGTIDIGSGPPLTIATAATNVAAGQVIPVALIGAQLPQMRIERRKMRGLESEGMMVSADELALPADWFEDGIMQFDRHLSLGRDVVEEFGLSDAVLDVDITSNRPDALSMIGLARELAAYQRVPLRLPALECSQALAEDGDRTPFVTIESPDCKRFVVERFSNVRVGTAPAWMRIRLALAGQRPINSVVDVSNYVMIETGQPLHFYDAERIPHYHLIVRDAREGEHLVTLDEAEYALTSRALVIAGEDGAEGLAGLKGGKRAEVGETTTAILLESATFHGARIRRMSASLGLRTDAGTRHEKTLPLILTQYGQARAAQLLSEQGALAHDVHAFGASIAQADPIAFDVRDVKRLLGYAVSAQEAAEHLDRLGFAVQIGHDDVMNVIPPLWRRDVATRADIIEEIARMAGYDRIKSAIPAIAHHGISSHEYGLEKRIAHTLRCLGYREIVSYALHGPQIFEKLARGGIAPSSEPVEVRNPLSEDQRYLRYALGPAMLEYFARIDEPMRIFEIGHVFYRQDRQPLESATLAFGFTAQPVEEPNWRDNHFTDLKADCEALLRALTGRREYTVTSDVRNGLHPGKTAVLMIDGHEVANVGRVDPRVQKAFDLRLPAYFCSLYLENVPDFAPAKYVPPSKYPSTYRDVALLCDFDLPAERVERVIRESIGALCTGVRTFDEYRGAQVDAGRKSLAVRITLQKPDATITDAQADEAVRRALDALRDNLGVLLRE